MATPAGKPLLIFPDPIWTPDMLSGALFLYFDQPFLIPIRSASSVGMLGVGPAKLVELVEKRNPNWAKSFNAMYGLYAAGSEAFRRTKKILEPLHGPCFKWVQLAYPHTREWLDEAKELLETTGLDVPEVMKIIHPLTAGDSLAKHVLFEMYVEIIHAGEDGFELGQEYAKRSMTYDPIPPEYDANPEPLYEYCNTLFSANTLESLLVRAFGLRLLLLQKVEFAGGLFLSNPALIELLSKLPVEPEASSAVPIDYDVAAWEIFRQLLSPIIDPLDEKKVELVATCRKERAEEAGRLKRKCQSLAMKLRELPEATNLQQEITQFIEREIKDELSDFLKLDKRTFEEFVVSLLSDEKTWAGVAGFLGSLFLGNEFIKAGSAVVALSSVGAKAVKAAGERRKALSTNSYALIYNLSQTKK